MSNPDLNLLTTLDVLLEEGSVARAARRLRLSPSAMSRTLARLRDATGDPLLVRAGRGLVPTPRAVELRSRVGSVVRDGQALLRPVEALDLKTVVQTFTLRTSDGFVENFGARLLARVAREAPGIRLNFLHKPDKDSTSLREGRVDLETAVVEPSMGPELRAQALFRDRLVGVVNSSHPLAGKRVTANAYARASHVIVSRTGFDEDAVDRPFLPEGLARRIGSAVSGFATALALARQSDLIATVPDLHTAALRSGMFSFPL
ncbi:MAG: LysR family transcriptional regulator, partial [Rhizomicrobium sp.]